MIITYKLLAGILVPKNDRPQYTEWFHPPPTFYSIVKKLYVCDNVCYYPTPLSRVGCDTRSVS